MQMLICFICDLNKEEINPTQNVLHYIPQRDQEYVVEYRLYGLTPAPSPLPDSFLEQYQQYPCMKLLGPLTGVPNVAGQL